MVFITLIYYYYFFLYLASFQETFDMATTNFRNLFSVRCVTDFNKNRGNRTEKKSISEMP